MVVVIETLTMPSTVSPRIFMLDSFVWQIGNVGWFKFLPKGGLKPQHKPSLFHLEVMVFCKKLE